MDGAMDPGTGNYITNQVAPIITVKSDIFTGLLLKTYLIYLDV